MIANAEKNLNKLCGKEYRAAFALNQKLGGKKQLPEESQKIQVLQALLDKKDVNSPDVKLYQDIAGLSRNVRKISSQDHFNEDLTTFSKLRESVEDADLLFRPILKLKLEEVRQQLNASIYSRAGLNKAIDDLFADIPYAKDANDLIQRKEKLLAIFDNMIEEVPSEERQNFEPFFRKFNLLKTILQTNQPNPPENVLFNNICVLQENIKGIKSVDDFRKHAAKLKTLVDKANSSNFVFESLIDQRLQVIQQALIASAFNPKNQTED